MIACSKMLFPKPNYIGDNTIVLCVYITKLFRKIYACDLVFTNETLFVNN